MKSQEPKEENVSKRVSSTNEEITRIKAEESQEQHLGVASVEARSQKVWKERGDKAGERSIKGNWLSVALGWSVGFSKEKGLKKS